MEETQGDDVKPASSGLTLGKGLGLIVGGALLGFFGCLGGLSVESVGAAFLFLGLGAAVIIWGAIVTIMVIWRRMSQPLSKD